MLTMEERLVMEAHAIGLSPVRFAQLLDVAWSMWREQVMTRFTNA